MTAPQLSPGYVIAGKYSVQALLGYGGSSATYRVVDATGNAFAVRIYAPAIAQRPEVMAMIEQIYSATNGLPPDAVLSVLARPGAKLGLIFLDVRRAAESLAKLL